MLDRPAVVARPLLTLPSTADPHGSANHTDRPPQRQFRIVATGRHGWARSAKIIGSNGHPAPLARTTAMSSHDSGAKIIDGKAIAQEFQREVRMATDRLAARGPAPAGAGRHPRRRQPGLAGLRAQQAPCLRRVRHRLGEPRPAPVHDRDRTADAHRADERRRLDRRHPGAGAAAGPHRRTPYHRSDRSGARTSTASTRSTSAGSRCAIR